MAGVGRVDALAGHLEAVAELGRLGDVGEQARAEHAVGHGLGRPGAARPRAQQSQGRQEQAGHGSCAWMMRASAKARCSNSTGWSQTSVNDFWRSV